MSAKPNTTHILGMAKSFLDLRGAKSPKLELDFLKLHIAIERFRNKGEKAEGYLLVFTTGIEERVNEWIEKYATADSIKVLLAQTTKEQMVRLKQEKIRNANAIVEAKTIARVESLLSVAAEGKKLGESQLRTQLKTKFPGITESSEEPLSTAWDFYGTIAK